MEPNKDVAREEQCAATTKSSIRKAKAFAAAWRRCVVEGEVAACDENRTLLWIAERSGDKKARQGQARTHKACARSAPPEL